MSIDEADDDTVQPVPRHIMVLSERGGTVAEFAASGTAAGRYYGEIFAPLMKRAHQCGVLNLWIDGALLNFSTDMIGNVADVRCRCVATDEQIAAFAETQHAAFFDAVRAALLELKKSEMH